MKKTSTAIQLATTSAESALTPHTVKIENVPCVARDDLAKITGMKPDSLRRRYEDKMGVEVLYGSGKDGYQRAHYPLSIASMIVQELEKKGRRLEIEETTYPDGAKKRKISIETSATPKQLYSVEDSNKVIQLLSKGKSIREISVQTNLLPSTVDKIARDIGEMDGSYAKIQGGFTVTGQTRDLLERVLTELMTTPAKSLTNEQNLLENLLRLKSQVHSQKDVNTAMQCTRCVHLGRAPKKVEYCRDCANEINQSVVNRYLERKRKTPTIKFDEE